METISKLFKALAEPVRLRILLLLLDGERCVCDLMAVRMVSGLTFRYSSIKFQHAVQTTYQFPCSYLMDDPLSFFSGISKVRKSSLTPAPFQKSESQA